MNRARRSRQQLIAIAAAFFLHASLLIPLLNRGEAPPATPALTITLWESEGPTSGPAPGTASGAAAIAAAVQEAPPAILEADPEPPAETPPEAASVEPPPSQLEAPAPASRAQFSSDLTTDPVDPTPARVTELLASASSSASSAAPAAPSGAAATLASLGGAGDPCQLTQWLQVLLAEDPFVRAALARLPPNRRSVANAVMLWDGRWAEARAGPGEDLLQPIRQAITTGLALTPAECREQWMTGPRFISVPDQRTSTTLALGSGVWRWADLLGPASPAAPTSSR
jgi:hypothetical protein